MLKTSLWTTPDSTSAHDDARRHVRRRQFLTIVFAIALILIAGVSSAQSPSRERARYAHTPQYDGATVITTAQPGFAVDAHRVAGGAVHGNLRSSDRRPVYAELVASLSNFDADADPDGWRAEVVLRDRKDRPLAMRSQATFELMPRVSTADHHRFVNAADSAVVRWSIPLEFDADSVARVKLPLRRSLRPMLGWSTAIFPQSGLRTTDYGTSVRGIRTRSRSRTFVTLDTRALIGTPSTGEMRVRVSVPTEGVFEAVTPVWIRPSVLVDTQWPYR